MAAEPTAAFHVRARLRAWLDVHRWPGEAGEDVILVASELVTNTIEHAYSSRRCPGRVDVTAIVRPAGHDLRQVHIEVVDRGRWRLTAARSDPHGLPLVTALMDDLIIITNSAGTQVVTNSPPIPAPAGARDSAITA